MDFLNKIDENDYEDEVLQIIKKSPTRLRPLWLMVSEILFMIGRKEKIDKNEERLSLKDIREIHSYVYYSFDKMKYFKEHLGDDD